MTTALLTPFDETATHRVGPRLYRKQVLPITSINYKGRRLDFTREYLAGLVDAFQQRAYDSVKFLLAPSDNSHTLDPERARGTVKGLELTADGLDALVELTDDGAQVVDNHPDLGVSVRIVEDLERADGKRWPAAVQHVLGTLDPRVTGMRPWEAVSLSNESVTVVDLTAVEFTPQKEGGMADLTDEQQARLDRLLALPEEQFTALLEPTTSTAVDDEPELTDAEAEEIARLVSEVETAGASLSNDQQRAVDLANARADEIAQRLAVVERRAAEASFEAYSADLVRQGVPPADLDLARPALLPEQAIDLANSDSVRSQLDASNAAIRSLLEARKGTVDLSRERGTHVDGGDAKAADDSWFPQYTATTSQEG